MAVVSALTLANDPAIQFVGPAGRSDIEILMNTRYTATCFLIYGTITNLRCKESVGTASSFLKVIVKHHAVITSSCVVRSFFPKSFLLYLVYFWTNISPVSRVLFTNLCVTSRPGKLSVTIRRSY